LDFEYVPSLHFAVAPVGSVLPVVVDLDDDDDGVLAVEDPEDELPLDPAAAFIAAPLAGGALAAGDDDGVLAVAAPEEELPPAAAFCTPPCPLQAPRPVAVELVPSLQVVGAAAAGACAPAVCTARFEAMRIREGTIIRARGNVFIGFAPRLGYDWGCQATA
jgi:hypothetical protein